MFFNFGADDNAVQRWKSFIYQKKEYSLAHINAQKVHYQISNKVLLFYVTYSHHCFCKTELGYNDSPDFLYPFDKDPRHFHFERYELSLKLTEVINNLPGNKVFHGGHGSYLCIELIDEQGNIVYYQVVFTVFRSAKKFRLHVTSAYPLPSKPRGRKVKFERIALALLQGRKLPRPPKN